VACSRNAILCNSSCRYRIDFAIGLLAHFTHHGRRVDSPYTGAREAALTQSSPVPRIKLPGNPLYVVGRSDVPRSAARISLSIFAREHCPDLQQHSIVRHRAPHSTDEWTFDSGPFCGSQLSHCSGLAFLQCINRSPPNAQSVSSFASFRDPCLVLGMAWSRHHRATLERFKLAALQPLWTPYCLAWTRSTSMFPPQLAT
jgi:hypothetical protein